jgi:hypothetical protein
MLLYSTSPASNVKAKSIILLQLQSVCMFPRSLTATGG